MPEHGSRGVVAACDERDRVLAQPDHHEAPRELGSVPPLEHPQRGARRVGPGTRGVCVEDYLNHPAIVVPAGRAAAEITRIGVGMTACAVDSRSRTSLRWRKVVRILRRFESSGGQGLVELVSVLAVFLAAVAVGLPGYLGFQDRKADKQARANLLAAVQRAEVYRTSHGSFVGMDALDLRKIDPRLSPTLTVASARRLDLLPHGRRPRPNLEHLRAMAGERRLRGKRRLRLAAARLRRCVGQRQPYLAEGSPKLQHFAEVTANLAKREPNSQRPRGSCPAAWAACSPPRSCPSGGASRGSNAFFPCASCGARHGANVCPYLVPIGNAGCALQPA